MMNVKTILDQLKSASFAELNCEVLFLTGYDALTHVFSTMFNVSLGESMFINQLIFAGMPYINIDALTGENHPCDGAKIFKCLQEHMVDFEDIERQAYYYLVKNHSLNQIAEEHGVTPLKLLVLMMKTVQQQ